MHILQKGEVCMYCIKGEVYMYCRRGGMHVLYKGKRFACIVEGGVGSIHGLYSF